MIRLVALACGLLCGAGFVLSGLHDPALLQSFLMLGTSWNLSLGFGLLVAVVTAAIVVTLAGKHQAPLLGGQAEPVDGHQAGSRSQVAFCLVSAGASQVTSHWQP